MEKIICYRCSKGAEILPEGIVWAPLRLTIIDYIVIAPPLDGSAVAVDFAGHSHVALLQWFHCPQCHHEYFKRTPIIDEGERIRP